jgi:hypothetical protein|tara:strand:- start:12807 stop:13121 length:315 start_codon:yes stop_codon:yes gene_type:complete
MAKDGTKDAGSLKPGQHKGKVLWDDSGMQTTFANVVNMQGTKEQIELFFGTNHTWNISADEPVKVELTNRMILTPFAAKRLSIILDNMLREYENRHGTLNSESE